jgi:Mg2+ and Co2+ transporter CorA
MAMTSEYKPDLDLWRDRAEEARTQVEQMTNHETRRMMLRIAETYERMIEFERNATTSKTLLQAK